MSEESHVLLLVTLAAVVVVAWLAIGYGEWQDWRSRRGRRRK